MSWFHRRPCAECAKTGQQYQDAMARARAEVEHLATQSSAHMDNLGRNGKARFLGL